MIICFLLWIYCTRHKCSRIIFESGDNIMKLHAFGETKKQTLRFLNIQNNNIPIVCIYNDPYAYISLVTSYMFRSEYTPHIIKKEILDYETSYNISPGESIQCIDHKYIIYANNILRSGTSMASHFKLNGSFLLCHDEMIDYGIRCFTSFTDDICVYYKDNILIECSYKTNATDQTWMSFLTI